MTGPRGPTEELVAAAKRLLEYRCHLAGCEVDQTDFCMCGMKEAADAVRAALNRDAARAQAEAALLQHRAAIVSPGAPAAARRAPTEATETLASWVAEELIQDRDDSGVEVFWYCAHCDGPNGATRDTVGHEASCPVGAAVTVLGALRAALAAARP